MNLSVEELATLLHDDASAMVPVAVRFATRTIELVNLAGVECYEPFFQQTIRRVVVERGPTTRAEVSLDSYARAIPRDRPAPDGFLFHTGRCGSTLLANMLAAAGRYFVLREPGTVIDLSRAWLDAGNEVLRGQVESSFALIVPQMLWATGSAAPFRLLKPSAWNIQAGSVLLRIFPTARSVFLYRDPQQTVASMLFDPPGWFEWIKLPRAVQARYLPSLGKVAADAPLSEVLFFAHAWRSAAETALEFDHQRVLFLDYAELIAQPYRSLERVVAHFGHAAEPDVLTPMLAAQAIYSKDPERKEPFDPNHRHRRLSLTMEEARAIESVTAEVATRLTFRSRVPSA